MDTAYFAYKNTGCSQTYPLLAFLDVGQGDSIYIRDNLGHTILVDTGPKDDGVIAKIQEVTSCSKVHIDTLILTHPDADHIGEAEHLIEKGLVGQVLHNGFLDIDQPDESGIENRLEKIVVNKRKITAGDTLTLAESHLDVLFPINEVYSFKNKKPKHVDDNDFSLIIKVTIKLHDGEKTFLLTGDAPQKVENEVMAVYCLKQIICPAIEADILKLGHHGSKNSSGSVFLRKVDPTEVVVSAGKNNRYHHPNEEVLQRVRDQAIQSKKPLKVRETSTSGNIIYR